MKIKIKPQNLLLVPPAIGVASAVAGALTGQPEIIDGVLLGVGYGVSMTLGIVVWFVSAVAMTAVDATRRKPRGIGYYRVWHADPLVVQQTERRRLRVVRDVEEVA